MFNSVQYGLPSGIFGPPYYRIHLFVSLMLHLLKLGKSLARPVINISDHETSLRKDQDHGVRWLARHSHHGESEHCE